MKRRFLVAASLILGVAATSVADPVRGTYLRDAEIGFTCWIPVGFSPPEDVEAKDESLIALFAGPKDGTPGLLVVTLPTDSIGEAETLLTSQGELRIVDRSKVGGRPSFLVVVDGIRIGGRAAAAAQAAVVVGKRIILFSVAGEASNADASLAYLRSILSTFRVSGDEGLDPWLAPARIDAVTGLGYRVPVGMQPSAGEHKAGVVYAGADANSGLRLVVSASEAKTIEAALDAGAAKGERAPKIASESGFDLVSEIDPPADGVDARARVAVRGGDGPVYVVEVSGGTDGAAACSVAERVGMSFKRVDIEGNRAAAVTAIAALEAALDAQDRSGIAAALDGLTERTYLPEVCECLRDSLTEFRSWRDVARALEALGQVGDVESADTVLKMAKDSRNHRPQELLVALLEALGPLQTSKAVSTLLKHAKEGPKATRVAAIHALGFYADDAKKIVKSFGSIMKRDERAAEKGEGTDKQDWEVLANAFRASLRRLTGEDLESAEAVTEWIKANR